MFVVGHVTPRHHTYEQTVQRNRGWRATFASLIRPRFAFADIEELHASIERMNHPTFEDLPFSYRLSQRAMLAAVATLLYSTSLAVPRWPILGEWLFGATVAGIAAFALTISSYVVIRYPYLSLVQTRDGDIFSAQFTSKVLARITKTVGFLTLLVLLAVLAGVTAVKGIANPWQVVALAYVFILFLFVAYLCFVYDPNAHPTIATFIRSTLGLGIVLMPLFIPVLIVGSHRCRRLLDAETARLHASE